MSNINSSSSSRYHMCESTTPPGLSIFLFALSRRESLAGHSFDFAFLESDLNLMFGSSAIGVPATYKRLMLTAQGSRVEDAKIQVMEAVTPDRLRWDEVLIRVAAAPVNPSDYGAWQSPTTRTFKPKPIGNEGAGTVVRVGSVLAALAGVSVGSKVGFTGLSKEHGSYAEYVVAPLATTFVMDTEKVEDAASFFVNPYTAVGIMDTAEQLGARAVVHTAAASQLGQMLVKLRAVYGGVELINVVRTEKQAATLEALGAAHVVVVRDPDDPSDELAAMIEKLGATVAFDAVAGGMTGLLVTLLPPQSTVFVYGRLDGDVKGVAPIDLIYRQKQLKGWYLKQYLMGDGTFASARRFMLATSRVRAGLAARDGWCATRFVDCTMDDWWATFLDMKQSSGFTDKKLRIRFEVASS